MRVITSRGTVLVIVGVIAILSTVFSAGTASAHATLLETTPPDGSVVAQVPPEVELRYDETVSTSLGAVKILAPDGSRMDSGDASLRDDGKTVVQTLSANLTPGTYTILWRVLSEDTHSIFGASTFSVGQPSATSASVATADQEGAGKAAEQLLDVARGVLYIGIILLVGGLAFIAGLWRNGRNITTARHILWSGWALAVLGTLAGIVFQGPYAAGLPLSSMTDSALVSDVLATKYGVCSVLRFIFLAGIAWVLRLLPRSRPQLLVAPGAIACIGMLVTTSMVGHAGTGHLSYLALPLDILHLASTATWLGGLTMLFLLLIRSVPTELAHVITRWSRYAVISVAVVVLSGTFAAWKQVREIAALPATEYGQMLLIKVALVLMLLVLGAAAQVWIRRRFPTLESLPVTESTSAPAYAGAGTSEDDNSRPQHARPVAAAHHISLRPLRQRVLLELAVAVGVVIVTAVLVGTTPAKDTYFPSFVQTGPAGTGLEVEVVVEPARTGLNTVRLSYSDTAGQRTDVLRSSGRWTSESGEFAIPADMVRTDAGQYETLNLSLPTAGTWKFELTTQTSDIDSTTTVFTVRIRR
ncbi:copper resistance CopC/CopD family protein [Williamsia muralis]|uniref:Copper resistance protein CopC n=1 Tax=Williamsia marianensis TaxID=85044 RepID=A0ABU4EZV7_WILMA|nr:copper resistance protein CopC [Williamsia muralis]MDV7136789.1 copper resistance protein CopC [Williamsia muralis]